MNTQNDTAPIVRVFKRGDMLSAEEAALYFPSDLPPWHADGRWFETPRGQKVYASFGAHKNGARGYMVLDLGGLK